MKAKNLITRQQRKEQYKIYIALKLKAKGFTFEEFLTTEIKLN